MSKFRLLTLIKNKYVVSTVKRSNFIKDTFDRVLGIETDTNYETIVFEVVDGEIDYSGVEVKRYYSEEEAKKGHYELVNKYEKIVEVDKNE